MSLRNRVTGVLVGLVLAFVVLSAFGSLASPLSAGAPAAASALPHAAGTTQAVVSPLTSKFTVTFTETNLPANTEWWVNITNLTTDSEQDFGTTGATLKTSLPNGPYNYTIYSTNSSWYAPPGLFTVSGAAVTVPVVFALVTYEVTFTESGLPSGTVWYVNITGQSSLQSSTSTISTQLPNATYNYKLATANKSWEATQSTGTFIVYGAPVAETPTFVLVTFTVTITASSRLPLGTLWYVNFTSAALFLSSTTRTITTSLPNGTYPYTVASSNKSYSPTGGPFSATIKGASYSKTITFVLVTYTVEAQETGLPSGTEWWFNITNVAQFGSTGSTVVTTLPNGSYPYTIGSANKSWMAPAGLFLVNGHAVTVTVPFSLVTYSVNFTETNLTAGTQWWVNLTNGQSYTSTTSSIVFVDPNGSYSYTIGSADKTESAAPGGFTINGANVSVSIAFGPVLYPITFTESGLPSGVTWYVNLTTGATYHSTTNTITFSEINGTYYYSIGSSNLSWASTGGSFTVKGTSVALSPVFHLVTYSVGFAETGLPTGTQWWVNLTNGQSFTSTTGSISFVEPNATYHYSVGTVAKRLAAIGGVFTIHGAGTTISVTFSLVKISLTFTGTGLPSSKSWFVVINGTSYLPTSNSVTIYVVNGSYPYLIGGPAGWRVTGVAPSGVVTVSGTSVTVAFTFTKGSTYPIHFSETGLPKGESWCVSLGSWVQCSSAKSVAYANLTPGSYAYIVLPMPGQVISAKVGTLAVPLSGTLGVAVKGLSVALKYVYPYAVTFIETGLTTGTSWSITIKGVTSSSTTSSIGFSLPNGTYAFKVGAEPGYTYTVSSHPAKVVGAPVTITVAFRPKGSGGGTPRSVPSLLEASIVNAVRAVIRLDR